MMMALYLLLCLSLTPPVGDVPKTLPPELEQLRQVYLDRQKLKSSLMTVEVYTLHREIPIDPIQDAALSYQHSARIKVWRDGERLRIDTWDYNAEPPSRAPKKQFGPEYHTSCLNCERNGYVLTVTTFLESELVGTPVAFRKPDHPMARLHLEKLDWRWVGFDFACLDLLRDSASELIAMAIDRFNAPDISIRTESYQDESCTVTKRILTGEGKRVQSEIWYSPSQRWHPVRWLVTRQESAAAQPSIYEAKVTWQTSPGGILCPKEYFERSPHPSKPMFVEITHTFDIFDFTTPIDPKIFTVGGLKLRDGQAVEYPELNSDDAPIWRNGKVDWNYTAGQRFEEGIREGRIPLPPQKPPLPPEDERPGAFPPPQPAWKQFLGPAFITLGILGATLVLVLKLRSR